MPAFQHVPGRDAKHEDRGTDVACRNGVDEFRLGDRIEDDIEEAGDLHAHGLRIERRTHRVLHPAIGDQDPQCREVRAERDSPGGHQMADLRQLVPAEEEQADKGRLQEEGHQAFDRQRCPENIADIIAVIAPVHAELEFHHDACGDTEHEIDAEQRPPELRHLPPDLPAGHDISRFHDGKQHGQAECQRHEQEVIQRRHGKLQTR